VSRCQRFDFKRIATDIIISRLLTISSKEDIKITEDAARIISRVSRGGMRDAISLLELCAGARKPIDDALVFANPKYDKLLFLEAFENDILVEFDKYEECLALETEGKYCGIDFELSNSKGEKCYVYATSIYLKRDMYAVFPHTINFFEMKVFEELIKRKEQGAEVCVFLIVPRDDCLDAKFVWDISSLASGAVYNAAQNGINFVCYGCNVSKNKIEVDHKLDILY
jgi:DNA-binding sugar fermentation-stimulating protein